MLSHDGLNLPTIMFEVLKRRFPCIGIDSRLQCDNRRANAVILALCIIHNICRKQGDHNFEDEDDIHYQDEANLIAPRGNLRGL